MLPQELIPLFPVALFHIIVTVEAVEGGFGNVNPPGDTKRRSLSTPDVAWAKPASGHCEVMSSGTICGPLKKSERIKENRTRSKNQWAGHRWLHPKGHCSLWWTQPCRAAPHKHLFQIFLWLSAWSRQPLRISDFYQKKPQKPKQSI